MNLQLARQEIDFVIIRCGYTSLTDGTKTKVDPLFEQNKAILKFKYSLRCILLFFSH